MASDRQRPGIPSCQRAVLRSGLKTAGIRTSQGCITPDGQPDNRLEQPCCTGAGLKIGGDSRIRSCILGRQVSIGSGVELTDCVVGDGAYIGDNVVCREAWIGAGAMLMQGSCMEPGSALGENSRLGEASVLRQGVQVYTDKRVPPRTDAAEDVRSSLPVPLELDSGCLCGEQTALGMLRWGRDLLPAEIRLWAVQRIRTAGCCCIPCVRGSHWQGAAVCGWRIVPCPNCRRHL